MDLAQTASIVKLDEGLPLLKSLYTIVLNLCSRKQGTRSLTNYVLVDSSTVIC